MSLQKLSQEKMTIINVMHCQLGTWDQCHPFQELSFLDLSALNGFVLESGKEKHCAWFERLN